MYLGVWIQPGLCGHSGLRSGFFTPLTLSLVPSNAVSMWTPTGDFSRLDRHGDTERISVGSHLSDVLLPSLREECLGKRFSLLRAPGAFPFPARSSSPDLLPVLVLFAFRNEKKGSSE